MPLLKINRFGRVQATHKSFNECKEVGQKLFDYCVSITCPADNTNKKNYVIDHTLIHAAVVKYFNNKVDSCEGVVKDLAKIVDKLLRLHDVYAVDIYIKVVACASEDQPFMQLADPNHAFMEYSATGDF